MDSNIGFEISLIVVEAMSGRCASLTVITVTVSEIFGGLFYFGSIDVLLLLVLKLATYCCIPSN